MTVTPETAPPGLFARVGLPDADNTQLTPFKTNPRWAGFGKLFVTENGTERIYPYIADGFAGHLPDYGGDPHHPLRHVETALEQGLGLGTPLHQLAVYVGRAAGIAYDADDPMEPLQGWEHELMAGADTDHRNRNDQGITQWQRELIATLLKQTPQVEATGLEQPNQDWDRAKFISYYRQLRNAEAQQLRAQVIALAHCVVEYNRTQQLYVAREPVSNKDTGFLGPLIGLYIDTSHLNDYRRPVHDVIPVVTQRDDVKALLRGAAPLLYTKSRIGA